LFLQAAAYLSVNSGSVHDPKDAQGLSHFLEHMLFLGTEKFPNDNEYNNFISLHSGINNAATSLFTTFFYFSIGADFLEEALDRFSQFFISPLFTESCTEREMNAVHSEHQKNLHFSSRRRNQIVHNLSNKDSYFNRFLFFFHFIFKKN
jgi:insulysin